MAISKGMTIAIIAVVVVVIIAVAAFALMNNGGGQDSGNDGARVGETIAEKDCAGSSPDHFSPAKTISATTSVSGSTK